MGVYLSRCHYGNGLLSVAVDSLTGEILELINESSGENLIKNSAYTLRQPFQVWAGAGGETVRLFGGNVYEIARDAALRPQISSEELPGVGVRVTVQYEKLSDGEKSWDLSARYTLELPAGRPEALWRMSLENWEEELTVKDVRFPILNGIYLGESWEDDTLVYPYHAGLRISDPVTVFASPHQCIYWKWQEYRYGYETANPATGPDGDGLYALECAYSGNLSMTWLDYYDGGMGIYFANHDPEPRTCSLRAETFGPKSPGMNFAFVHHPALEAGERWESPELVSAVHEGDWHQGARLYRAFREQHEIVVPSARPAWFEKSPGLMAHYDFKYQNGGIVHKYADIPRLLGEARELGINHLLLAGWHRDGFDHGFPAYVPDGDMGTPEELRDGIRNVTDRGGHVCFYINSRLANVKYPELREFIQDNVIVRGDGTEHIECYGNQDIRFAAMCINTAGWQEKMRETLRVITEEIGVDGVYLDQLAMAPPGLCCNKAHGHERDRWNRGYQALLDAIIRRREEAAPGAPMSIIHEGVSDSYGGFSSGQLISTFMYHHIGAFPELYQYTYPEQILVDMLYPEKNMAMRPVHVGQASTAILNRAFTAGFYYWIYDLVDDNTFIRDPGQYAYLKNMIALRSFWLSEFGRGLFRDSDGVEADGPALVKRFDLPEGLLLACAREKGREETAAAVVCCGAAAVSAYTAEEGGVQEVPCAWKMEGSVLRVELPQTALALIRILPAQ